MLFYSSLQKDLKNDNTTGKFLFDEGSISRIYEYFELDKYFLINNPMKEFLTFYYNGHQG